MGQRVIVSGPQCAVPMQGCLKGWPEHSSTEVATHVPRGSPASTCQPVHPLRRRAGSLTCDSGVIRNAGGPGWYAASDLANDDALDHILEQFGKIVQTDSRFLQAAKLMNIYIGPAVSTAVLDFFWPGPWPMRS